ncbi:hypothetical protein RRG08_052876 [Elysia crispata]|uniref:Uncharacterized protein n=1 Tax=Elysia crispata TaxID=231223 RepID=A0AAE1DEM3_9GAST|nr:hypothetical protein RRG08_052876 [Elysia crispata]
MTFQRFPHIYGQDNWKSKYSYAFSGVTTLSNRHMLHLASAGKALTTDPRSNGVIKPLTYQFRLEKPLNHNVTYVGKVETIRDSIAHPLTDTCHTLTDICRTLTDIPHPLTDICHILTDISHPLTDICHTPTDILYPLTDICHTLTDISHPLTDMCHTLTDILYPLTGICHTL